MTRLTHPALDGLQGISHGFFTRLGGASTGLYASLNCGIGSSDDQEAVRRNRAAVAETMGVADDALATPYQVHGSAVVDAKRAWTARDRPKADGLVTDAPGLAIGVGTADCGPILFADSGAGIVAAAHAGWKGAIGGVCEATIDRMEARGADRSRIVAVLGPTISQANYEVDDGFRARFLADAEDNERWFAPASRPGHAMFDLPGYIVARLQAAGIATAAAMNLCTYADEDRFYSYRRATHRGEPDYGRMLAVIALAG